MTKEEANEEVARLIAESEANVIKAQELANEHGLIFNLNIPDAHHMQDTYKGKHLIYLDMKSYYDRYPEEKEYLTGRWCSSSAYC
jgi:hypothetical protein